MEFTLEKLQVYNEAEAFSDEIWSLVNSWKLFDKDTIGKQLVRAADSISVNIAEGYGRFFYRESKQFYFYARGSILETKSWIGKCKRRNLLPEDTYEEWIKTLEKIHVKLNAYIKFISQSAKHNPK